MVSDPLIIPAWDFGLAAGKRLSAGNPAVQADVLAVDSLCSAEQPKYSRTVAFPGIWRAREHKFQ